MQKKSRDVIVIDENVRTRSYEKYLSRGRKFNWKQFLQPHNILDTDFKFTSLQFYVIVCFIQLDVNFLLSIFLALRKSTPMFALGIITFLLIVFNLPVDMLYIFVGKYTRNGFINFWDFIPMLKGVGYSTLFVTYLHVVYIVSVSGLLIFMLIEMYIHGVDFTNCVFAKGSRGYSYCVASDVTYRIFYPKPTCSAKYVPSPVIYVLSTYTEAFNWWTPDGEFSPNIKILTFVILLWLIVLFVSYQGWQRIIKYVVGIILLFMIIFFIITLSSFFIPGAGLYDLNWASQDYNIFDMDRVNSILAFCVLCTIPGPTIYMGALCPNKTNAGSASVLIIFIKLLITFYVILWVNITFNILNNDYQLGYFDKCAPFTAILLMIGMTADAISRALFGKLLVFLYYMTIIVFVLITMIIITIASVESLMQQFPLKLKRFRFLTFATYISFCIILNFTIITCGLMFYPNITTMYLMRFHTMCAFLANISLSFIYPLSRLCNDYFFLYGKRPMEFWTLLWRTCPLLLMFCCVLILIQFEATEYHKRTTQLTIITFNIVTAAFYIPLLVYMLWIIYRYFHSHKKTPIISPENTWGPPTQILRDRRNNFYPERDLKYLHNVPKCKHKCPIGSEEYRKEVKEHFRKLNELIKRLKRKHNVD